MRAEKQCRLWLLAHALSRIQRNPSPCRRTGELPAKLGFFWECWYLARGDSTCRESCYVNRQVSMYCILEIYDSDTKLFFLSLTAPCKPHKLFPGLILAPRARAPPPPPQVTPLSSSASPFNIAFSLKSVHSTCPFFGFFFYVNNRLWFEIYGNM